MSVPSTSTGDTGDGRSLLWVNHFAVAPGFGGGTRHFDLGRELGRLDWAVMVACSDFHYQSRVYTRRAGVRERSTVVETIEGVEFHWLWAAPYASNDWRRAVNWLSFARGVTKWSPRGGRPDVVIGSSPHLFAALAGERLARRLGVPFVFEVRDLWPESLLAAGGRWGPMYTVLARIAAHLYRRADRILVLARGSARYLADELGVDEGKLVFVPNGVDLDAVTTSARRAEAGPFTLVYAGAHGPANGLEIVLRAADLLREHEHIRFRLLGDGPSKAVLRAEARELGLSNVEFLNPVAKQEIPRVLAAADAGLMILRDAPLFAFGVSPNKLFDYLGAALPVVCNVPGEVAEMLASAGAGEQASDSSAPALAEAVLRLAARSPAEREAMGRAGREWVVREHGHALVASRLDRVLRELV